MNKHKNIIDEVLKKTHLPRDGKFDYLAIKGDEIFEIHILDSPRKLSKRKFELQFKKDRFKIKRN